jgi:hypothetical protein
MMERAAWEPLRPREAALLLAGFGRPWWIAGGYAIELAVGRQLRAHADLDILLLRGDLHAVHRPLRGWELWAADPPGRLRPWMPGETLPPAVHDIWCRPAGGTNWRLQLMLDESDGADWVSRRDARIRRPFAEIGGLSADGIPHLVPEVQLFYKAREPRPKDDLDLAAVLPLLGASQVRWLAWAIETCYGPESPWLGRLTPP